MPASGVWRCLEAGGNQGNHQVVNNKWLTSIQFATSKFVDNMDVWTKPCVYQIALTVVNRA